MKIYLIYGGKSAEHDVSVLSAHSILNEIYFDYYSVIPVYITRDGVWLEGNEIATKEAVPERSEQLKFTNLDTDVSPDHVLATPLSFSKIQQSKAIAFPVLHGPNGEDGTVQGLFETLGIPYVGCGVLASACGMDKLISKHLFEVAGLPQVPYVPVRRNDWEADKECVIQQCEESLEYPFFVKPANLGSSVGISKAETAEELIGAINLAFEYDRKVVVEQGVQAREIEVAVLGNEDVHTSVPGELVKEQAFYDYDSKYINNDVELSIPADVSESEKQTLREYAKDAFLAIDGSGLSRVDFFLTDEGTIYINEINTFPGFTQFSMYPRLWESTGLHYGDLIEELIQLGLQRHAESHKFTTRDR